MRQNPLHIVALVVCLNGLFTTVVRAENEASKTGSLHWTPHRAAARPLDVGGTVRETPEISAEPAANASSSELAPSLSSAVVKSQQIARSSQVEKAAPAQRAAPATVSVPDTIPAQAAKPSLQIVAKAPPGRLRTTSQAA